MQRLLRPIFRGVRGRKIISLSVTKSSYFCSDAAEPLRVNLLEEFLAKHEITIQGKGSETVQPIFNFDELTVSESILRALKSRFESPSVIQSVTWPAALTGRDLVGVAKTGSGKTLAFLLPALVHISKKGPAKRGDGPVALVLCPTRELAQQVESVANEWGNIETRIRTMCAFGGASRGPQLHKLTAGVEIVVATPGRLNDFLDARETNLRRCSYLVLDEADRMLDMGFEPQIRQIITRIGTDRQTLMYSATWPNEVRRLALDFMKDYVYVKVGSAELAANKNITQIVHVTTQFEKDKDFYVGLTQHVSIYTPLSSFRFWKLLQELQEKDPQAKMLVFSLRKASADRLSAIAERKGLASSSIHGDKSQAERDRVMSRFRQGRTRVLFATDVAARGLDVDDIKYVVNYDHPFCVEDYVHRIGRTARREQKGQSHTFLTEDDAGNNAKDLIKVLEASEQPVPKKLQELASLRPTSKKGPVRRWGSYSPARQYADSWDNQQRFSRDRHSSSSGRDRNRRFSDPYDRYKNRDDPDYRDFAA